MRNQPCGIVDCCRRRRLASFDGRRFPRSVELLLTVLILLVVLLLLLVVLANRSVAVLALFRRFSGVGWSTTSSAEARLQSLGDLGVDVLVHAAEQRIAALLVATRRGTAVRRMVPVLVVLGRLLLGVPAQTGRWLRRTTAAAGAKVLRFGVRVGIAPALALAPRRGLILGRSIGPPRLLLLLLKSGPPSMPASVCCRRRRRFCPAQQQTGLLRFFDLASVVAWPTTTHAHFYTLVEDFSHTNYILFFLTRTPLGKASRRLLFPKYDAFPNPQLLNSWRFSLPSSIFQ